MRAFSRNHCRKSTLAKFSPVILKVPPASSSGWWLGEDIDPSNCIAAYLGKGTTSYADSKTNLANPGTYDLSPGVDPTWNAGSGWTFNGSSTYLDTGVVPTGQSWSYMVQYANAVDTGSWPYIFGEKDSVVAGAFVSIGVYLGVARNRVRFYNGAYGDYNDVLACANGNACISKKDCFINASYKITLGVWNLTSSPRSIYLGGINIGTGITNYFSGDVIAFAIYNIQLTGDQITTLYNTMSAF